MATIIINETVEADGSVHVVGLPLKPGSRVRITVETDIPEQPKRALTVQDWLDSGLIGMWADRDDIGDSVEWVNKLRESQERRDGVWDDSH